MEMERKHHTGLCPVFKKCGGCQYLDLPYASQLAKKEARMRELLRGICEVKPIHGMEDPFHYRNKTHAVFGKDRRRQVVCGIYQEGTHRIVPVTRCMIENEKADEIIQTIRGMIRSFRIPVYDEDTGYGLLRHVLIRTARATGEIMVVLVTAGPVFPSKNNFVRALREKHPEITTVIQNINGKMTSMVLGEREHVLWGRGSIEDVLCGMRFEISSRSFYQINPVQTEYLYGEAMRLAGLGKGETAVDAYCGIGTIGLLASRNAGQVIGVELNSDAVRDAVRNARRNGIRNIRFYQNDAGVFMNQMAAQGARADVVFLDPPRTGSTEEFLRSAARIAPSRIVYISCGPESLARDLRVLGKLGYRAESCQPVDMFPETDEIENAVLLRRQENGKGRG
jgi:23S rRNA (uracil1939-C5)-methyltransferase